MKPVTDAALLEQLNAAPALRPVTDEKILFELNSSPSEPSIADRALRSAGLGARAIVKGVSAIPTLMAEGAAYPLRALTGGKYFQSPSAALDRNLTAMGLPEPQNATERVTQDVVGGMSGAGAGISAGRVLANSAGPVVSRIGQLLASNPQSQVVGAAGAAGGGGVARESGAGPVGQTVAALLGGVAAPISADVGIEAAKAAGRGVSAAVAPFTRSGREAVVGSTLRRFATNPDQAIENMGKSGELVQGSKPTAAQAARDEGLLIAERGVTSANPEAAARMSRRASEQNAARTIMLNGMSGDEAALGAATTARDESTKVLRDTAFKGVTQPVNSGAVVSKIDEILNSPQGKQKTVATALRDFKAQIDGETNPESLYAVRKDINLALGGKLSGERQDYKLASSQLIEVKKSIDEAIEQVAPGFRKYLDEFATQSKPINQMESLQGLTAKVQNAGTDAATGERIMSASKFANVLRNPSQRAELKSVLTPQQFKSLEIISADLDRAALSASSGKAAGSNTTQNISTAYVLGKALGGDVAGNAVVRNLSRPLQWLNRLNEREVQELLTDAMLDPGIARSLMQAPSKKNVESLGFELLQRSRSKGIGAASATATELSQRE